MGYAPAGRLDLASSGLLVFTRCGVMAKKLVGASGHVEKEYAVKVCRAQALTRRERSEGMTEMAKPNRNLSPLLRGGKRLFGDDRPLRPLVDAEWIRAPDLRGADAPPGEIRLTLREGRKHQVRRMCRQLLGLHVTDLVRVRVGGIALDDLPPGKWRPLRESEARSVFFAGKGENSNGDGGST